MGKLRYRDMQYMPRVTQPEGRDQAPGLSDLAPGAWRTSPAQGQCSFLLWSHSLGRCRSWRDTPQTALRSARTGSLRMRPAWGRSRELLPAGAAGDGEGRTALGPRQVLGPSSCGVPGAKGLVLLMGVHFYEEREASCVYFHILERFSLT